MSSASFVAYGIEFQAELFLDTVELWSWPARQEGWSCRWKRGQFWLTALKWVGLKF